MPQLSGLLVVIKSVIKDMNGERAQWGRCRFGIRDML